MSKLLFLLVMCPALSAAASLDYQKTFGGKGSTAIAGVATDAAGNVYIAGNTTAFDLPVKNAYQPRNPGTAVVVSRDAGRTWAPLGVVPDFPFTGVAAPVVSPKDANLLIAAGVYGVYRSTDAGSTWKAVVDLNVERARIGYVDRVEYDPRNPSTVYVSSTGGVLKSTDAGVTWTLLNSGIQPGNCCTGAGLAIDPFMPQRLIYTINERAYLSQDGGATWNRLKLPAGMQVPSVVMDPFAAGTWYAYDFQGAFRTEDAASTWIPMPLSFKLLSEVMVDPSVSGRLYARTSDGLLRSNDRGRSWQAILFPDTSPKLSAVTAFQIEPSNPNWLVAAGSSEDGSNHICLFSQDGGQSWQPMGVVRPFLEFRFSPSQPNVLYAGGSPTVDSFVAKVNPSGDVEFLTYLGGQGSDSISAMALDAAGNIYLAGTTESIDFPGVTARLYPGLLPSIFATKLDASGRPVQTTLFGGAGYASVSGFALDPGGTLLVSGSARSPLPATNNALSQFGAQGGSFVIKLASDGSGVLYSSALPGNAGPVASDPAGNFLVAGDFLDNRFPRDANGNGNANLLKFSPTGSLIYATFLPVTPARVVTDSQSNIYVAGNAILWNNAPATPGAFQSAINTDCPNPLPFSPNDRVRFLTDVYVAKLDPDGRSTKFGTFLGGSCRDMVTDMEVGTDGSVWVAGDTESSPFPLSGSLFGPPPPGFSRPFVTHLDATGSTLLFSSYLSFGSAASIAPDAAGNVFVSQNTPPGVYYGYAPIVARLAMISAARPAAPSLRRVVDAFSRANVPVAPQEIVVIEIPGFQPASEIDLGLQPAGGAPFQLGGVSVEFNGVRAPMIAVRNGEIECVTPAALHGQTLAAVQVVTGTSRSGRLEVDVAEISPAIYQVRNSDGTLNSPRNPAPPGSQVTFLITGAGLADPVPLDGSISGASSRLSSPPINLWFDGFPQVTASVGAAPGFLTGIYAARTSVPPTTGAITVHLFPSSPAALPFPFVDPTIQVNVGAPLSRRPPKPPSRPGVPLPPPH